MLSIFRAIGGFFMDIIESGVVALSVFLIIYLFIVQPHQVNGVSMFPNFHNADYVLTDKISYKFRQPKRGEVVVFHAPPNANCKEGTGCEYIKRVLGLPGETVEIKNTHVYINGQVVPEEYIPLENPAEPGDFTRNGPITLGPDEYMVIGDNRPHSSDSRAWGPITPKEIIGHVFLRYWPASSFGMIPVQTYPEFNE